jgi:hypothetical protein
MHNKLYIVGALLVLLALACSAPALAPATTPTSQAPLSDSPTTVSPSPTLQATALGSPLSVPPPTTDTTAPELPGFQLLPSNSPDRWLLYDSSSSTNVLLWDGRYLWAGLQGGGLVQWEPQALAAVRHTGHSGFPLATVNDLAFDPASGTLYAVGDAGLAIWDGQQWQHLSAEQIGFAPGASLRTVLVESGATLWVGADESYAFGDFGAEPVASGGGLAHGDWQANTWQLFTAPQALLSNQVNDLALDAKGNLWVATGQYGTEPTAGGVSWRDPAGNWSHYGLDHGPDGYQPDRGLDGYAFGSLAVGPDGTIYAASRLGVSWLTPGAEKWRAAAAWDARQMAFDTQGMLWVAAREGLFVLVIDSLQSMISQSEYDNYLALAFDGQGDAWFGGEIGLFEYLEGQPELRQPPGALPGRWVTDVAINGDGALWLRSGETVSRITGDRIEHFASERQAIEAAYPWTGSQALWPLSPDGTLWLLESSGLSGFNGAWQSVPLDIAFQGNVSSFVAGPDGLLVAANSQIISRYTPAQGWQFNALPTGIQFFDHLVFDPGRNAVWAAAPTPISSRPRCASTWQRRPDRWTAAWSPTCRRGIALPPTAMCGWLEIRPDCNLHGCWRVAGHRAERVSKGG